MDCREATEMLLVTIDRPEGADAEALAHVAGCADCAARNAFLLRGLAAGAEDRLSCAQAEEQLPEYLAAVELGQGGEPAWDYLRLHLAGCPACAATMRELGELLSLAEAGPAPPAYPAPRAASTPAGPRWRVDQVGRVLVEMLGALAPPAPLAAGLKAHGSSKVLGELTLTDARPDLIVEVALLGDPAERRRSLMVKVDIPSRGGWPNLAGSEVGLLRAGQPVDTQQTDSFGVVVFSGLVADEVSQLALSVRPAPEGF